MTVPCRVRALPSLPANLGGERRPCQGPLWAWPCACLGNLKQSLSPEPVGGLETTGPWPEGVMPVSSLPPGQGLWVTGLFPDGEA